MKFHEFIKSLTRENLEEITSIFNQLNPKKPVYNFGNITHKDLKKLFTLERGLDESVFKHWFNTNISLIAEEVSFLKQLLAEEKHLIRIYNEEDLKAHLIIPILNKINFKLLERQIRDFYEASLAYETKDFILKGTTDFLIATGIEYPEQPYFFIQEFKRGKQYFNPEPQLLAKLISAIELNHSKHIKGAFIIGENWNFAILNKQSKNHYQYFISQTFNATKLDDLKQIYKNLLYIKARIIKKIEI